MFFVVDVVAFVLGPVGPLLDTVAVLHVVLPVAFVGRS